MRRRAVWGAAGALVLGAFVLAAPAGADPINPVHELRNMQVTQERHAQFDSPAFVAQVARATSAYQQARYRIDHGRAPDPNGCTTLVICAIDPRLTHWRQHGGIVAPVLYTARSGATLAGNVWATERGPARRPAVLIINGSILGYEQAYWFAAQALARAGFVVMTFDAQGEGMSDQFGQAPDQQEGAFAGTPMLGQSRDFGGSGLPFYDGGEDSLDFLLSTPQDPYLPVPSRTTSTSHAGKQRQRVAAGLDSAYDPLWRLINRQEIGIAGHSYGAEAASWLAQSDPRVKAGVAWDDLCVPVAPSLPESDAVARAPINRYGFYGEPRNCFGAPMTETPPLHTPVLGMSSDYFVYTWPYFTSPDPDAKGLGSLGLSAAGVDTGEIVIRGGTHYDFMDYPSGFLPASRRGIDMATWYTIAWFDKYLRDDPRADRMLLTRRWRSDPETRRVDPLHDANLYSTYYRSRLDIGLDDGQRFDCENLQRGCIGQTHRGNDCGSRAFSYISVDLGDSPYRRCGR
jgi:dienelactone hydrolase